MHITIIMMVSLPPSKKKKKIKDGSNNFHNFRKFFYSEKVLLPVYNIAVIPILLNTIIW